jgi:hypothetical protein
MWCSGWVDVVERQRIAGVSTLLMRTRRADVLSREVDYHIKNASPEERDPSLPPLPAEPRSRQPLPSLHSPSPLRSRSPPWTCS